MQRFVRELPALRWQKDSIVEYMRTHPDSAWKYERNLLHPNMTFQNRYLRVKPSPLFDEVYDQLAELELKPDFTFFAEIKPRSLLAPHVDVGRPAVLNFPLEGDFTKAPVRFHDALSMLKESVLYEHAYVVPTILNVTEIHSVYNPTRETRYILSMSIHKSWDEIQRIVDRL